MANVTKPIALNETFKTTGNSPKNIADVLEDNGADLITQATAIVTQLQALINAVKPNAADIPLAPITGMSADDVQEGISELKQSLDNKADKMQIGITTSSVNSVSFTIKPSSASNALIIATRREGNGNNDGVALIKVYNGTPFATVIGGNITISNLTFDTSTNTITFTIGTYYNVVCIAN